MDTLALKYPYGRCSNCGEEFNELLRKQYFITHCPWCGQEIDDYLSAIDSTHVKMRENDIFCEECGQRIYERHGKNGEGGDWLNQGNKVPGVCSGPCERELCGNCGDWDINGECEQCRNSPCGQCPNHDVVEMCQECDHLADRALEIA